MSPAFSRCVRTISRARKRRREGRNGRREDGEESVWILHRGLNVVLRDNRCSTPPLLFFFPRRCFCARHAKKFFLSRRCQNRTGGGRDLIYRGGGISSFSIAALPQRGRYRRDIHPQIKFLLDELSSRGFIFSACAVIGLDICFRCKGPCQREREREDLGRTFEATFRWIQRTDTSGVVVCCRYLEYRVTRCWLARKRYIIRRHLDV